MRGATAGGGSSCRRRRGRSRATEACMAAVGIERGGGGGSVEDGRGGCRVGGWQGRQQEPKGRGMQWNRVLGSFYTKQTQFHPSIR
jgi:hypothetical protein